MLFEEELGTVEPYQATIHVKLDATLKFHKPRPVLLAIKGAIGWGLDRMEREGVIKCVDHSDWAAPIVAIPRKTRVFAFAGIIR